MILWFTYDRHKSDVYFWMNGRYVLDILIYKIVVFISNGKSVFYRWRGNPPHFKYDHDKL